jgi:hypothetical protein
MPALASRRRAPSDPAPQEDDPARREAQLHPLGVLPPFLPARVVAYLWVEPTAGAFQFEHPLVGGEAPRVVQRRSRPAPVNGVARAKRLHHIESPAADLCEQARRLRACVAVAEMWIEAAGAESGVEIRRFQSRSQGLQSSPFGGYTLVPTSTQCPLVHLQERFWVTNCSAAYEFGRTEPRGLSAMLVKLLYPLPTRSSDHALGKKEPE